MRWWPVLLLAGCTTTEYVKVPVEVKVPIPVPCVATIPHKPTPEALTSDSSDGDILRALLVERERLGVYVAELEAILTGCSRSR